MSSIYTTKGAGGENKSDMSEPNRGGKSEGKKKEQSDHERRRSNLINTNSLTHWDETTMDSTGQAMGEAMRNMMESMQTRVDEESRVLSEMEERAKQDTNFAKLENADKWSTLEVCHWLNSIHLQKYIPSFHNLCIDGSILLQDVDESMLANELGVKKIHLKKCLREITKLKEAVQS
ncbi:neurabin-1-like protein, partial [Reticulomyxa filosa]